MTAHIDDFVNREQELAAIWQVIGLQSTQRLLLIRAQDGMGKSYLLDECQAQCQAQGIACVRIDFAEGLEQGYMSFVWLVWEQLGDEGFERLRQAIAQAHTLGNWGETSGHIDNSALEPSQEGPDSLRSQDQITAVMKDIGPQAQVAVGKQITQIIQIIRHDDLWVQNQVRLHITNAFRECLIELTTQRQIVFLLDSWQLKQATTELRRWLKRNLLAWILEQKLQGAVAIIAGSEEPDLPRYRHRIRHIELKALPDEAVRTYWVEKRRLPLSDVAMIMKYSGGHPLSLALIANQQAHSGGAPPQPEVLIGQTVEQIIASMPQPIGQTVEQIIASMPQPIAEAIRLGSIPHSLGPSEKLLRDFQSHISLEQLWTYCKDFDLAKKDAQGRIRYRDGVRDSLLTWWREKEPARYQALNQVALNYFWARSEDDVERPHYQYQISYHLLIVDEAAGLAELATRFEAACDRYQFDEAERFVRQATELQVSDTARLWIRYFETRLDLLYHRDNNAEATLQNLAQNATSAVLQAVARWTLGTIQVNQHSWSEAIKLYKASLASLKQEAEWIYTIRVMLALGDAYRDLAEKSGGFQTESDKAHLTAQVLDALSRLPFVAYTWLVRHISILPNWYFGANYQEWIIAYLAIEATSWYRQAAKLIKKSHQPWTLVEVQLALAELEHQVGRWSSSWHRYSSLLELDEIKNSPYRTARVKLGQGSLLLSKGNLMQAEDTLSDAHRDFLEFNDQRSIGLTTMLLGRSNARLSRINEAISFYGASIRAFSLLKDQQACTQILRQLQELEERALLSKAQKQRIQTLMAPVNEQHYITRFPDHLLRGFRRLALFVALPLNYLFSFIMVLLVSGTLLQILEGEIKLFLIGANKNTSVTNMIILLGFALSPLLALWIYHAVYSVLVFVAVRFLGRLLIPIEKEQPSHIVLNDEGITYHNINQNVTQAIKWSEVSAFVRVEYWLWQQPTHLFSRVALIGKSDVTIVVDALTSGYTTLKKNIEHFLSHSQNRAKRENLDFIGFDTRWTLIVGVICLAFATYLTYMEPIQSTWGIIDGPKVSIFFSTIVECFILTGLVLFPATLYWRLLARRRTIRKTIKPRLETVPTWLLWVAAILQTLIAILWILLGLPQR